MVVDDLVFQFLVLIEKGLLLVVQSSFNHIHLDAEIIYHRRLHGVRKGFPCLFLNLLYQRALMVSSVDRHLQALNMTALQQGLDSCIGALGNHVVRPVIRKTRIFI